MKNTIASILVVASMAASPAQAQSVEDAGRAILEEIRTSLVAVPAAPAPMSVTEAIREQGGTAARNILLETELTVLVNTTVAMPFDAVERSGLVTVSELEVIEETDTESVEL